MSVQILTHLMENFVSFLSILFNFSCSQTVIMLLTRIEHRREMHQLIQVKATKKKERMEQKGV